MNGSTGPDPTEKKNDREIGKAVFRDLRNADLFGTLEREFRELYRFYLDPETRERLEKMGRIPRAFWLLGWLSKSLLLKLSPTRRILLLLATVMSIMGWTHMTVMGYSISYDLRPWGCLLLLFILMLELKDKMRKEGFSDETSDLLTPVDNTLREEALSALITLGINKSVAEKNIAIVLRKSGNQISLEELIKQVLKTT